MGWGVLDRWILCGHRRAPWECNDDRELREAARADIQATPCRPSISAVLNTSPLGAGILKENFLNFLQLMTTSLLCNIASRSNSLRLIRGRPFFTDLVRSLPIISLSRHNYMTSSPIPR